VKQHVNGRCLSSIAISFLSVFYLGCSSAQTTSEVEAPLATTTENQPSTAAVDDCSATQISSSAAYTVDASMAAIAGDTFSIRVATKESCTAEEFYACWPGIFRTSNPLGALINLVRRQPSQTCAAGPKNVDVTVDLSVIKAQVIEMSSPHASSGSVSLQLNNPTPSGSGLTIPYMF
jgi:hypothetical protein